MSDELIKSLNGRITELTNEKANLQAALKESRGRLKAVSAERDEFAEAINGLTDERDTLAKTAEATIADLTRKASAGPEELTARIKELEGSIAARDHRDSFKAAASKAGVSPDRIDDLYGLSGLKPGAEPAKPEDFADFLAAAKDARPWAFAGETSPAGGSTGANGAANGAAANGSQAALNLARSEPATGGGRGASGTSVGPVSYTLSEVRASGWAAKRPELRDALANGTAVLIGE